MALHPGLFVVRNKTHVQNIEYGRTCSNVIQKALENNPFNTYLIMQNYFADEVRKNAEFLTTSSDPLSNIRRFYGVARGREVGSDESEDYLDKRSSPISTAHHADLKQLELDQKAGRLKNRRDVKIEGRNHTFFYILPDGNALTLSKVEIGILSAYVNFAKEGILAIQNTLQTLYQTVTDKNSVQKEKQSAIRDIYYIMSHYCPLERGSATLAMITLRYLEVKTDQILLPLIENMSLNAIALITPHGMYAERFQKYEYFDHEVKLDDILNWQKQLIEEKAKQKTKPLR